MMVNNRLNFIGVGSGPGAFNSSSSSASPSRSGQLPALSPLDAFAFQGKLLATKFDQRNKNGQRLSRLPPLIIADQFGKPGSEFYKSVSDKYCGEKKEADEGTGDVLSIQNDFRPQSQYPLIESEESAVISDSNGFLSTQSDNHSYTSPAELHQPFGAIPRTQSPDPMDSKLKVINEAVPVSAVDAQGRSRRIDSVTCRQHRFHGLPRSPAPIRSPQKSPSGRSTQDSTEDYEIRSLGSMDSWPRRKFSSNAHSPVPRSASGSSELSTGGAPKPRSALKYHQLPYKQKQISSESGAFPGTSSSKTSRDWPSVNIPSRQNSGDVPQTPSNDLVQTSMSLTSDEGNSPFAAGSNAMSSYIYSKYALPRGRTVLRESVCASDFMSNQFNWNDQLINGNTDTPVESGSPQAPPLSPPSPRTIDSRQWPLTDMPSVQIKQDSSSKPNIKNESSSCSKSPCANHVSRNTVLERSRPASSDFSAEDHLEKGIACHEAGELQKSTYHLRVAAKLGHSTAMLLYALACRHGWGIRQNPAEGVQWLRRAADTSQLEVADDEVLKKQGKISDGMESKTHKAQFALSVYELGVSYMNGWGVDQDKSLAVRCFEIAGNRGDLDALAEAGFCYTKGIGCKKNLKKAAKFYRMAEANGMTMTGSSWIYKEKYMDNESDSEKTGRSVKNDSSDKKSGDKSRTLAIFSRKKSFAT